VPIFNCTRTSVPPAKYFTSPLEEFEMATASLKLDGEWYCIRFLSIHIYCTRTFL